MRLFRSLLLTACALAVATPGFAFRPADEVRLVVGLQPCAAHLCAHAGVRKRARPRPPTETVARRLLTYSEGEPIAKVAEEQLLFKDMLLDLADRILRQVAIAKRDM